MIIEAAREAFCQAGSSGASIREVAQRAGVSEPTVYQHFESRDELYRAAIEDHLASLFDVAAARARTIAADDELDRDATLAALNELYLQLMIDTAPLSAVSFFEVAGRGKALYQSTIHQLMVKTATPFYEVLTGQPLAPEAENVVMMSLFGMHYGVALDAMMREIPVDVEQMAARITNVYR
jgi:AcrR family transcriptional regulator